MQEEKQAQQQQTQGDTYKVQPEAFWAWLQVQGCTGYDAMEYASRRGWHAISGWGRDGWDLGSWPYVIVFVRDRPSLDQYQLVEYVEGDVTLWSFPTKEARTLKIDELAFLHWKHNEEEWVKDYATFEEYPLELRGPFSWKRVVEEEEEEEKKEGRPC